MFFRYLSLRFYFFFTFLKKHSLFLVLFSFIFFLSFLFFCVPPCFLVAFCSLDLSFPCFLPYEDVWVSSFCSSFLSFCSSFFFYLQDSPIVYTTCVYSSSEVLGDPLFPNTGVSSPELFLGSPSFLEAERFPLFAFIGLSCFAATLFGFAILPGIDPSLAASFAKGAGSLSQWLGSATLGVAFNKLFSYALPQPSPIIIKEIPPEHIGPLVASAIREQNHAFELQNPFWSSSNLFCYFGFRVFIILVFTFLAR